MRAVSARAWDGARLDAMASQARRLSGLSDRRVVWLLLALISVDLLFVAVHAVHTIYASMYTDRIPVMHWQWNIVYDRSYLELFGYSKTLLIISLLLALHVKNERLVYLVFAVLFTFVLLDDSLMLHETIGQSLADALALRPFAGLRPLDFGELLFWAGAALPLLGLAAVGLVTATGPDQATGLLLLGALAVLMVFGAGFDMVHVMVEQAFRGAHLLFSVIEQGGQQITLSLTCGLAVLIRREVRSREPARGTRG